MATDVCKGKSSKPSKTVHNSSLNSSGYASNEDDNIKVYLRIRPPSKDIDAENENCLEACSTTSLMIATKPDAKQFSFDHVAGMDTTQEEVFSTVGKGIIEAFVDGFNGTIFAYGQTGSGKTFTMLGPPDDSNQFAHELRGVIPRSFEYAFSLINRKQEKAGDRVEFLARCAFIEIYNEVVYDLLSPSSAGLALRENIKKGVFVEGLTERSVTSAMDAYKVLQSGWLNRRVASTSMNRESSRSHAVFTVTLESKEILGGVANIKESKLHLVDLAGSERQKDTQTEGSRLKEAGSINKSLSALGNVIMALVDIAHGRDRYIHYRDSKLTFILRDSLGGNAKTYIIANVHPSSKCFGETLSTLNFARRAKMIKNKAVVNEDVLGNVRDLQAEIKKLKAKLSEMEKDKTTAVVAGEVEEVEEVETVAVGEVDRVRENADQWKQMMLSAVSERESTEKEKRTLKEKIEKLEDIIAKKDKFIQSTRMILKFRNQHINKMQRKLNKECAFVDDENEKDNVIQALKEELKCLHNSIENHPDIRKLNAEISDLRAEVKRLKSLNLNNGYLENEMAEKHRYTMQLERQLKEMMTTGGCKSANTNILEGESETDNIRLEVAQLQVQLENSRHELEEERKIFKQTLEEHRTKIGSYQKQEMEMQCNLTAAEKCKTELEHTLESFRLKSNVERKTLNSLHMQTVTKLVSPANFRTPRRLDAGNRTLSTPLRSQQTPLRVNSIMKSNSHRRDLDGCSPPPKLQKSFEEMDLVSADKENVQENSSMEETQDEEVYVDALQEEMSELQKLYNTALEDLNNEKQKILSLSENLTKAETKASELEELLQADRVSYESTESDLKEQLSLIQTEYAAVCSNSLLSKGENSDLKIMFNSLGKQLDESKKHKEDAHVEAARKYASLESQYTSLQVEFYTLRNEMDEATSSNRNLQSDFEQCKEELQFVQHKNSEMKDLLGEERKNVKQLQDSLEKLEAMVGSQETSETVNELRGKLHDISKINEAQNQSIAVLNAELEASRLEVAEQIALNASDKEVINTFMRTVEDANVKVSEKESQVTSLRNELVDITKELEKIMEAKEAHGEQTNSLIASLRNELKTAGVEKEQLTRKCSLMAEETKQLREKHADTIQTLKNQHMQVVQVLEGEQADNTHLINEKNKQIAMLEGNLSKLDNNHTPRLLDEQMSSDSAEKFFTCNDIHFDDQFRESESWDTLRVAKPSNEQRLTEKIKKYTAEREVLENRIGALESEHENLENQLEEKKNSYAALEAELRRVEAEKAEKVFLLESARSESSKMIGEQSSLRSEVEKLQIDLRNVREELCLNAEEVAKTKTLEQKYFENCNRLQSELSNAEEERVRFLKKNEKLQKKVDSLEVAKTQQVAHQNTKQRIDHLVSVKKENNKLQEEVRMLRQAKCPNCSQLSAKC